MISDHFTLFFIFLKKVNSFVRLNISLVVFIYNIFSLFKDIVRFQKENQQLKEQLVKSVNLVKSGRVSINSVERGDNVMVVWNEEHE